MARKYREPRTRYAPKLWLGTRPSYGEIGVVLDEVELQWNHDYDMSFTEDWAPRHDTVRHFIWFQNQHPCLW